MATRTGSITLHTCSDDSRVIFTTYYDNDRQPGTVVTLQIMMGICDAHIATTREGLAELHAMLGDALEQIDAQSATNP